MRICLSTCPLSAADDLAGQLLTSRLAACVNVIGPIRSHYWWQGRQVHDDEALLVIKTAATAKDALQAFLAEIHPYDVPEIVFLCPDGVWPPYLAWLAAETHGAEGQGKA
ncbi:MAG: divalent cation tolerance protein CutA [Cyanobacteria bacterium REEB65]|nr:divalent cation tolerance protein CutA [Cyanobacteria bacterium REEB65]